MSAHGDVGLRDYQHADATASPDRASSGRYVWYVISLLFLANVLNYMDRMALSVLLPSIKVDLHLSDTELGLLAGFAFFLFYATCGIPFARWADRGVRRTVIAFTLVVWSLTTALSGAAQNFWQLFAARMGTGAGEAGGLPPAQSLLCDYVPPQRRAGVFAFHTFGLMVGLMVGMALAGWLSEQIGWRWTFVVLGLPGIGLAMVILGTLREPRRGAFELAQDDAPTPSLGTTLRALWKCRSYRFIVLMNISIAFFQSGLTQWWPSYYVRSFGLNMATVGVQLGVAIGVGSGLGLLIGGMLANRMARRDIRRPLFMGAAAAGLAVPTSLGSLLTTSSSASMVLAAFTALLWCAPTGSVLAALYGVTMPRMRATAGALCTLFSSLLGFALGPLSVGFLSDLVSHSFGADSLRYGLIAPICILPVLVSSFLLAARELPNDLAMVRTKA